ncbi:MAG: DUF4251 domain-containing protein [Bacteroidia bacterium]|nr:DUF4251 domain-containing protein [Bacteroidia bacterium]MBT8278974.1 DUF4251 domain-containing protein [Bacteroidia bacterium]NND26492.1 DUF4251 domain-containing protein [Flavobacteriaceae bacterium]NNK60648.1 DUF4251 domain-containing protein [Flavobacteriaceae bacterium]NNL32198.1 DUF4251 domain-containing protein [Flavobacteriaceae bacterium]
MKTLLLAVVSLLFWVPTSSQNREDAKNARNERIQDAYEAAKDLVETRQFTFRSNWMNTQGGKRIQLDAGSGYLTLNEDQANAYFPYFGTVRVATMYEGGGIEFDTQIEDFEIKYNDERKIINITFMVAAKKERYEVLIQLYKGLKGSVTVFSNKRDQISYDGYFKAIEH